jgi:hypothetical protein
LIAAPNFDVPLPISFSKSLSQLNICVRKFVEDVPHVDHGGSGHLEFGFPLVHLSQTCFSLALVFVPEKEPAFFVSALRTSPDCVIKLDRR